MIFCLFYKILNKRTHKAPMWYLKKSEPFGRLLLLKRLRIFFVIAQLFSLIKLQKNLLFISVRGACGVQVFSVGNTCAITCVQLVELCKAQPSSYPSGLSIRCQRQKTVKQSTNPQRPKERVYLFFVQFQASEWLASKKAYFGGINRPSTLIPLQP